MAQPGLRLSRGLPSLSLIHSTKRWPSGGRSAGRSWAPGAGALLLALVLSWIIAHNLSVPIRALVEQHRPGAPRQFRRSRPGSAAEDELGHLALSFNEMAAGLAQKERYRTILNMVADEKVAQRLVDRRPDPRGRRTGGHRVVLRHPPIHRLHAEHAAG